MIDIPSMVHETVTSDRYSKHFFPSEIDSCVLKSTYRIKKKERTHPEQAESRWFLKRYGTYEEYFLDAFKKHGVLIAEQPKFKMGNWSGRADFLIQFPPTGGSPHHLVEVKSVNPGAMKRGGPPYKHHKLQVWTYCVMAEQGEVKCEFEKAILAYITRWDDGKVPEIRQYDVTPMQMELDITRQRMTEFEEALALDGFPDKPYHDPEKHPWDCTGWNYRKRRREIRCPYFGHCWPNEEINYTDYDNLPF